MIWISSLVALSINLAILVVLVSLKSFSIVMWLSNVLMRVDCNTHYVLPLEGSREACNPHQAVYLIGVV